MKKNTFLFCALALGLTCSAFGELQKNWEIVTVDNEAVYFLDRNSINLSEEQIGRVWQLKNFRQIKRVPPQSISSQMDYDCEKSRKRIFLKHHHSGVMAKGRLRVANTEGQFDWKSIESDPVSERIFFIVCGKEPNIVASNTKQAVEKENNVADELDGKVSGEGEKKVAK
ncbi:hypothetical protein N9U60_01460 [Betaproteobacteria bacterium]|nr:hypothetical protein [Betaproteobacteria bacterium]